jgi:hypothetical protein
MALIESIVLFVFLIVAGLQLCGAALPRWALFIGGLCGIIAGVLGIFG